MDASATRNVEGRERELDRLGQSFADAEQRSNVLIVVGEPGSGKTTLLDAAVAMAEQAHAVVLRCAPVEAESSLPFAALGDLLAPVTAFAQLEEPQRHALERALLRSESSTVETGSNAPPDARSVGHALVQLLRSLRSSDVVVLVVDDVQWLDQASASVLQFALRRLPDQGVAVWAARRRDVDGPVLAGAMLELPPLANSAIERIVGAAQVRGGAIPLGRRRTIVDAANGNPLFAIELTRAYLDAPFEGRQTLPSTLSGLLAKRFGDLDAPTIEALAAVALLGRPPLSAIRELGIVDAVEHAERDGVVDTATGRVLFVHPLFAASVLEKLSPMATRALHRQLAGVVDDPIDASRHAALAAEVPDADLAAQLSAHADELAGRAAIEHAAELAALAVRLSPAGDPERASYCVAAADLAFRAGDAFGAVRLLDALGPDGVRAPSTRVAELLARSRIAFETGIGMADEYAAEALQHATSDHQRVEALTMLAHVIYDDFDAAAAHGWRAVRLAETTPVPVPAATLAAALDGCANAHMMSGGGLMRSMYERAMVLERDRPAFASESSYSSLAVMLKTIDHLDEAREMLLTILRSDSDDGAAPFVLSHLPQLELWAGNWDLAEDYAHQHLDAALRTGQHDQTAQATYNLAFIDVHRGNPAQAERVGAEMMGAGIDAGSSWTERNGAALVGLAAVARGDAATAVTSLGRWAEIGAQIGLREPGYSRLLADLVEALVATGDLDRADSIVSLMTEAASRLERSTSLATAWRVGALVAAARGDRRGAVELATDAVDVQSTSPLVFEHARALLTLGQVHRRFREKSAARRALESALDEFVRLGAEGLAERTRLDLARIGLRPPARSDLTETERRVARAAATGRTVRQVGDELFISPKTVEGNLTRVYRKLGLSGRAELAAWVAAGEPEP